MSGHLPVEVIPDHPPGTPPLPSHSSSGAGPLLPGLLEWARRPLHSPAPCTCTSAVHSPKMPTASRFSWSHIFTVS